MPEIKETGLIIKILDYDDYDQIITILTDNEILTFIALGVRKITSKNRVALQLGNIAEIEIFKARLNGKLSKLKRATLVKQPPIEKADTAIVLLEIIKYLNKVQNPNPELLHSIYESFDFLGGEYNHHIKTFVIARVLKTIGYGLVSESCVECGRKDRILGFDFYKGGFTCIFHTKNKREISYLKAVQALGGKFINYNKIDHAINALIYKELINFINSNNF